MTVGLVIVSHSGRLAEGVVELASEMAPDVRIVPAGGMPDGSMGTDFEKVSAALSDADSGSGVLLLYDLGSAHMIADLSVESLGDPSTAIVSDAPMVEGSVAAAVAAQGGSELAAVGRAADEAVKSAAASGETGEMPEVSEPSAINEEFVLHNEVGLHARPAALLARSLTGLSASVTLTVGEKQADAASVLGVMGLGARKGDRVLLSATGPDARDAVTRIVELSGRNFDE